MATTRENVRERRARERATWPGQLTTLAKLPESERLDAPVAELVGLVRELTLAAWAMRGEALPSYPREHTPGRVLRPGPAT